MAQAQYAGNDPKRPKYKNAIMWPTPKTNDYKGHSNNVEYHKRRAQKNIDLCSAVGAQENNNGQLNPEWVEWLMGYPSGWTDLKDSETQ
jgi:hypothetical protein